MSSDGSEERFGCEQCWPPSAPEAWEAKRQLILDADLIDESHFHIMIRACPACAQRFLSIFTETVDWADGDDPQYWAVLPITDAEAAELRQKGDSLSEKELKALPAHRRCLRHDAPKGSEKRTYWAKGISVGFTIEP